MVVVLAVVKLTQGSTTATAVNGSQLRQVVSKATTVPVATLDEVGATGSAPRAVSGAPALRSKGRPEVLYVGAEFCPYCAAERWPLVVALSRFGTFTGLQATTSAGKPEALPNTATFTFLNATYTSPYLAFTPIELQDRDHKSLRKPTGAQQRILTHWDLDRYTGGGDNTIPFVYYGGTFVSSGAAYDGSVLGGKSHTEIATALQSPDNDISKSVNGSANTITASLCTLTGGEPAAVCTSPGVKAAAARK